MDDTSVRRGLPAVLGGIVFVVIVVMLLTFLLGLVGGIVGYGVAAVLNELFGWGLSVHNGVMIGAIVAIAGGTSSYEQGE